MSNLTFEELLKYAKRTIKDMHDENGNIKPEYQELINKVNNAPEYRELITKLQNTSSTVEIEKLKAEFEYEKYKGLSEEEKISKQYGISLESIEHVRLQDGKEFYHFYDGRINKDIVIGQDNQKKNMSEEFKEVQEGLSLAQGANEKENGEEAFRYQRMHTNNEVKLYSVEEIIANPSLMGNISMEQLRTIVTLLKNKDTLKIREINPETGIAITDDHKIISAYYNENTNNYEVSNPSEFKYSNDTVGLPDSVTYTDNNENIENVEVSNDNPEQIDELLIDEERVKLYYEYPELLDRETTLTEEEKAAYMKAVENYKEKEQAMQKDNKPKVYVLKNKAVMPNTQAKAGYIDLLLLSLTVGFAGGIITAIMIGLIR